MLEILRGFGDRSEEGSHEESRAASSLGVCKEGKGGDPGM